MIVKGFPWPSPTPEIEAYLFKVLVFMGQTFEENNIHSFVAVSVNE